MVSLIYFLPFIQYPQRALLIKDRSSTEQEYDEGSVVDPVDDPDEYSADPDSANPQTSIAHFTGQSLKMPQQGSYTTFPIPTSQMLDTYDPMLNRLFPALLFSPDSFGCHATAQSNGPVELTSRTRSILLNQPYHLPSLSLRITTHLVLWRTQM